MPYTEHDSVFTEAGQDIRTLLNTLPSNHLPNAVKYHDLPNLLLFFKEIRKQTIDLITLLYRLRIQGDDEFNPGTWTSRNPFELLVEMVCSTEYSVEVSNNPEIIHVCNTLINQVKSSFKTLNDIRESVHVESRSCFHRLCGCFEPRFFQITYNGLDESDLRFQRATYALLLHNTIYRPRDPNVEFQNDFDRPLLADFYKLSVLGIFGSSGGGFDTLVHRDLLENSYVSEDDAFIQTILCAHQNINPFQQAVYNDVAEDEIRGLLPKRKKKMTKRKT